MSHENNSDDFFNCFSDDEDFEVKVVEKILHDFKQASSTLEFNSEILNKMVEAHHTKNTSTSTKLTMVDVKAILHQNLAKFWQFAVRQPDFQVSFF